MELYTLNINVNKQRLSFGENKPEIFSGDQSIDFVEFTFEDDMWNFPDIWAIFSRFKGTSYQVSLEDNKVMIPAEVMQKKGYVYIGLMATDGENVQTSSVLQYSIGQGSTNVDAITPSASIYEQFLADLDAYQTAVADLDDIESRITTAAGNVSMIEQAVTDLNEQLGDINVDISTINGQITTIQNNIGTAQSDIVSIQNWINTLNGQVAGLDTAVGTLSNRVTALQSSVTSLEGRLTTVGNTLTDFEGRLTTAGTTLTNLEGSISDAENDIQTVQGDIETIQSDIEDIQTAIEQNNVVTDVTAEGISLVDNHIADLSFMCVTDTASGDVASFPDGSGVAMKKAEVSLEPIQDLHGYDKPWSGGAGKNKLNVTANTQTIYGITYTVNRDSGGNLLSIVANGIATSRSVLVLWLDYSDLSTFGLSGRYTLSGCPSGGSDSTYSLVLQAEGPGNIVDAGSGITFDTSAITQQRYRFIIDIKNRTTANGLVFKPMLRLATESDATYSPYENICPIDGYEDVGVSVRGVNMWDEEWEVGSIGAGGVNASDNTKIRSKNYIPVLPNTTYYIKSPAMAYIWSYDADKTCLVSNPTGKTNATYTTASNEHFIRFRMDGSYGTTYNNDISINYPSTDHDYHVYAGTDYTTDLGRTVYGGTVDLTSGRLVVDRAIVDLGTLTWTKNWSTGDPTHIFYTTVISDAKASGQIISSGFKAVTGSPNAMANGQATMFTNSRLYVCAAWTTDATALKTSLNGVQLVYELATPQTYQLTPQQIQTLVGANNVWSEDGAIEVEYIANLKDYIDKKINA